MRKIIGYSIGFVWILFLSIVPIFVFAQEEKQNVFVIFDTHSSLELREKATESIQNIDAHVVQLFPEKVAIISISSNHLGYLKSNSFVEDVFVGKIDEKNITSSEEKVLEAVQIWNGFEEAQKPHGEIDFRDEGPLDIPFDKPESLPQTMNGSAPHGAGYYDTSEFLHGSVSVAVILTESNGATQTSTENWTVSEENNVKSEIANGLNWWTARYVEHNNITPLSFTTHFYEGRTDARAQTQYEPIVNSGTDELTLWGHEIMGKFGFNANTGGTDSYFYRAADFINNMRNADGTDWGVVIFVADDTNDIDKSFTDGRFAYAWLGGPSIQMTYDNGGWGIAAMDTVVAHELGHSFYALDQYASSGLSCLHHSGYLDILNSNFEAGCISNENSIMRGGIIPFSGGSTDPYARGQIGWRDSDGDFIPDILDLDPIFSNISVAAVSARSIQISGNASVQKYSNQNQYDPGQSIHGFLGYPKSNITVDTISKIEYQVDGGGYALGASTPIAASKDFSFTTPSLPEGVHHVDIRATSLMTGKTVVSSHALFVGTQSAPAGAVVQTGDAELSVRWSNPESFSEIRVLRKEGGYSENITDGDRVYTGSGLSFTDFGLKNGVRYYYSVFACGGLNVCSSASQASGVSNSRRVVTGSGKGRSPKIRTFGYLGDKKSEFLAYSENVTSGVEIAVGDVDGDGVDEIIAGAGPGGGPQVRIFDVDGNIKFTNGFFAYSSLFRGGIHVAAADVDGDGKDEIITGAGVGGGPHVRIFNQFGVPEHATRLYPYPESFKGGVYVSGGDLDGDGVSEVITGPGNGGGPQIRVFNKDGAPKMTNGFFAYGENFRGGVLVSSADLNNDGTDEIIAGSGFTGGPQVRTFKGNGSLAFTPGFFAYDEHFRGGVFVAGHDLNGDGKSEIITGTGYSGGPHIRIFTRYGVPYLTPGFFAEDTQSRSGTYVAAGNF